MNHDLSADTVAPRLERLRDLATRETVEDVRRRLGAEPKPSVPFARAVSRRLAELRALSDLTEHLHRRLGGSSKS